ncbi:MAG: hypothetical protein RLO01_01895 [Thalassobaculaceae bacterium]
MKDEQARAAAEAVGAMGFVPKTAVTLLRWLVEEAIINRRARDAAKAAADG